MTGTTTHGLPYPDPTDPLAEGADAIKALAQKLDPGVTLAVMTGANPILGTYNPNLGITAVAARANVQLGGGVAIAGVPLPPGVTCILACSCLVDGVHTAGYYGQLMIDNTTLGSLGFQIYNVSGIAPNGILGVSSLAFVQIGAATKPGPDDPDEATPV